MSPLVTTKRSVDPWGPHSQASFNVNKLSEAAGRRRALTPYQWASSMGSSQAAAHAPASGGHVGSAAGAAAANAGGVGGPGPSPQAAGTTTTSGAVPVARDKLIKGAVAPGRGSGAGPADIPMATKAGDKGLKDVEKGADSLPAKTSELPVFPPFPWPANVNWLMRLLYFDVDPFIRRGAKARLEVRAGPRGVC